MLLCDQSRGEIGNDIGELFLCGSEDSEGLKTPCYSLCSTSLKVTSGNLQPVTAS